MKKTILFTILFLVACTATETTIPIDGSEEIIEEENSVIDWMSVEAVDVNTGETYTIGQFDKPVFVESFAVWCPTCTRQQLEFKKFHETNNNFVSIALDTDPNENADAVKEHAEANGFDWRYSVSPAELTQGLIDEFGLGVVNAPAVPVVFFCPGEEPRLLGRGIKDQNDLMAALETCGA